MSAKPEGLKKFSLFHLLIIAALAIGLYLNTFKNGFVYDDVYTVVNNTLINRLDNLPLLFDKTAYFSRSWEMSYRPVVTFTYFIDYALHGLKPWGYHLTNVLLHAVNGVLLYFFLTLLLTPHHSRLTSPPFLTSILFVAHPILTEAVNCISYREDLLTFLFYVATLSLYLILRQPTSDKRPLATALLYLLSCLTYLLALLSKEMAVTLPLIIFCYEWFYSMDKTNLPSRLFNRYSIGYIMITLFYLYLRFYLFHNPEEQIQGWNLFERFLTLPWLILSYLKLSLFSVHLSADYVITPVGWPFSPIFILSIIALVSIFIIIFLYSPFYKKGYKRFPPLANGGERGFENLFLVQRSILFGALFFLLTLAPVYNLVPLPELFAERYLYLPVSGLIMSTVYIAYLIAEKIKVRPCYRNSFVQIFSLVVLIIFSFSVVNRNPIWRDNYSLWSDTVAKMPNSSRTYNALGNTHYDQGRIGEAIRDYLTALKLKPNYAEARYNLGNAYARQGLFDQAIKELLTAIRLKQDYPYAYNNLGIVYTKQGLFDQAIKEFLIAIRLEPNDATVRYNLGIAYLKQGRYDDAINEFMIALKLKPDYKEAYGKLEVLIKQRKGHTDARNATTGER